jgi:hypothetical protein
MAHPVFFNAYFVIESECTLIFVVSLLVCNNQVPLNGLELNLIL